jgi:hypothetical protein
MGRNSTAWMFQRQAHTKAAGRLRSDMLRKMPWLNPNNDLLSNV